MSKERDLTLVNPDDTKPQAEKRRYGAEVSARQKKVVRRGKSRFNTSIYVTEEFFDTWDRYIVLASKLHNISAGRLMLIAATSMIEELEEELPKLKTVRLKSGLIVHV